MNILIRSRGKTDKFVTLALQENFTYRKENNIIIIWPAGPVLVSLVVETAGHCRVHILCHDAKEFSLEKKKYSKVPIRERVNIVEHEHTS